MIVHLTTRQLDRMLKNAAEVGAKAALVVLGELPKYISQRQAYEKYGTAQVKRWVKKCWVSPIPSGEEINSKLKYSVIELETANAKSIYENSTEHIKL